MLFTHYYIDWDEDTQLSSINEMRHILCNYASVELLDWEDHVPVFAPDYIAVFDGELLEVLRLDVAVVLWVWICKNKWLEIHSLGCAVAEEDVKAHVSCIFSSYDVKSCGFHCYFTFLVICVQRTLFLSTKKFIHFSTMFL